MPAIFRCECDESHIWEREDMTCRVSSVKLGEECQSTKQCARLNARCKTLKVSTEDDGEEDKKVCQCLNMEKESRDGKCVDSTGLISRETFSVNRLSFCTHLGA